jgi:hypothetical protein
MLVQPPEYTPKNSLNGGRPAQVIESQGGKPEREERYLTSELPNQRTVRRRVHGQVITDKPVEVLSAEYFRGSREIIVERVAQPKKNRPSGRR